MSLIGDLGNPQLDAAALDPVLQHAVTTLVEQFTSRAIPVLQAALVEALDGLTITIVVSKKVSTP